MRASRVTCSPSRCRELVLLLLLKEEEERARVVARQQRPEQASSTRTRASASWALLSALLSALCALCLCLTRAQSKRRALASWRVGTREKTRPSPSIAYGITSLPLTWPAAAACRLQPSLARGSQASCLAAGSVCPAPAQRGARVSIHRDARLQRRRGGRTLHAARRAAFVARLGP